VGRTLVSLTPSSKTFSDAPQTFWSASFTQAIWIRGCTQADLLNLAANTTAANAGMVEYAIDFVGLSYDAGLV